MIPRFDPGFGLRELGAFFDFGPGAVEKFERAFASSLGGGEAVSFAYGRSALYFLLKAFGLSGREIIVSAYTCVVVAHAVKLSGNIPRFVDVSREDGNMSIDETIAALGPRTGAVIATHLFGNPLGMERLRKGVREAEKRFGRRIPILHDCAHGTAIKDAEGRWIWEGDAAAFFGLNISKNVSAVFGGAVLTRGTALAARLRELQKTCRRPPFSKRFARRFYFFGAALAFKPLCYGLLYPLLGKLSFLKKLQAYYSPETAELPEDFDHGMLPFEARIGTVQLGRLPRRIQKARRAALLYERILSGRSGVSFIPASSGSVYSHYPLLVEDPARWIQSARKHGIELGRILDYVIPGMPVYGGKAESFPAAARWKERVINIPVHGRGTEKILRWLREECVSKKTVSSEKEKAVVTFLPYTPVKT